MTNIIYGYVQCLDILMCDINNNTDMPGSQVHIFKVKIWGIPHDWATKTLLYIFTQNFNDDEENKAFKYHSYCLAFEF